MVNGYSGAWTGEQQLAERAIREHLVGYFGNLDPFDGGDSQRYMFHRRMPSAHWWRSDSKQSNDEDYERT